MSWCSKNKQNVRIHREQNRRKHDQYYNYTIVQINSIQSPRTTSLVPAIPSLKSYVKNRVDSETENERCYGHGKRRSSERDVQNNEMYKSAKLYTWTINEIEREQNQKLIKYFLKTQFTSGTHCNKISLKSVPQ